MGCWLRTFPHLDIVHLSTFLTLCSSLTYLLVRSILYRLNECNGFYIRCYQVQHPRDLTDVDLRSRKITNDITAFAGVFLNQSKQSVPIIRRLHYDWVSLNQYAIFFSLLATSLFGSISAIFRSRILVFIAILLHLVLSIQLALIEASDDRDFPKSVFRRDNFVAHHSLIFLDSSLLTAIIKFIVVALLIGELVILIVYFVVLRYEILYRAKRAL